MKVAVVDAAVVFGTWVEFEVRLVVGDKLLVRGLVGVGVVDKIHVLVRVAVLVAGKDE